MQRLHSSLAEARNNAVHLQESLNRLHEGHHFRKDYQKFLERANSLLKQIEQTQHHAPEVVSLALHKLTTANGCLATALREERGSSTPSFLGSIGSIGGLAPVHTDSFRNAERLLLEAMEELRNPGPIGDSNPSMQAYEQPGTPVGPIEQRADPSFLSSITSTTTAGGHQQAVGPPEQTGLLTQYTANLGSMLGSIGAMAMGPGPSGTVGNLCVAVNYTSYTQLDLYAGCREKQLRSYSLEKQQKCQGVKCMTYDPGSSTIWTGHADGSIKVHRIKSAATEAAAECSLASDTCRHGVAVTSLVIEAQDSPGAQPRCWAGDAEGSVCVRKLVNLQTGQLHLLVNATVVPCENQPRPPKYLPVGAMLQLGSQMLVSGGCVREGAEPAHRLQLWDCKKMKSLREFACRCGPVTCLELLSDVLQPPSAIESVTSWRSSISEGDMGSGSCSVAYRLLSGHADGQVVLWELTGRGAAPELRELAVIGEYSKDRVVRSIFAFPQWDMLVVATSSSGIRNLGKLRVMHLPSPVDLEQAESKRRQATAAPHRNAQPTVDLKVYVHEAHKQKILATAHLGESIVTASTSSVKFWSPKQLALYAAKGSRGSLTFNRISTSSSGGSRRLSDTAGITEALASKSSSDHQSPFVRTQQQQSQQQPAQAQVPTSPQAARVVEQASQAQPMEIPVGPPSMQPRPSRAHEFVRVAAEGPPAGPPSICSEYSVPSSSAYSSSAPSSRAPSSRGPSSTQGTYPSPYPGSHPSSYGPGWMNPAGAAGGRAVPHIPWVLNCDPPLGAAPGAPYGPFGAAAAGGMGAAGGHSSCVAQGWAGTAPMSTARAPMSPVPGLFRGVSSPPMSPTMAGGVPPWQSPAPTRPLSPAQWQQQQQELAMQQHQEEQQRKQQEGQRREQQAKLEEEQARQRAWQRTQHLVSVPQQRGLDAGSAFIKGAAPAAAAKPVAASAILSPGKSATGTTAKVPPGVQTSPKTQAAAAAAGSSRSALSDIMPADPVKPGKQQQQGMREDSSSAVEKVQAVEQAQVEQLQLQKQEEVDAPARAQAEVAAHCGYQFVRQLPDQTMFGSSRALQVRCSRTNRLRTLLQVPRNELRQLAADGTAFGDFKDQLVDASKVHHPHMLQVQEVFVGPLHLNIVLEECSAGRLLDYPAKQASAWGSGPGAAAAAALSPEFARWFFQQAVLAVHYYHSLFGSAEHRSKLSMMNTLLKVAPTLPQPVVKVPSTILARGISAFTLTGSPSVSKPGEDPFIPPEVYDSRGARGDTPAGDVWACGVLLLKLLGGQLKDSVYPKAGSSSGAGSSSQGVSGVLFEFPAQQDSSVDEATRELLSRMLKRQPHERITLERLRDHPWFLKGLPPNAHSMTDRFLKASRACRQSEDELRAAVDAAGAGLDAPMQLLQQVKQQQRQHKAPKAKQSAGKALSAQQLGEKALLQKQPQVDLLQGLVTPELQHGLQLQLHSLRHACLQLYGVSTAAQQGGTSSSSSVSRLTELLAAQQAAASAVSTFTAMDVAARALQQHSRLLRAALAPLSHSKRPPDSTLGMAQLLQLACTDALFRIGRLQQLLQGTTEPSRWAQLQASVPARGKGAAGNAEPVAWERTLHLLKVQAFLLEQAHGVLHSLWVCRAAAAAVSRACLGRKRAAAHGPGAKPLMLTAVLGPDALAAVVVSAALQLQQPAAGAKLWQRQGVLYRSAAVSMLMLVHLNEARHSQQQQWQRGQVRVQSVRRLEDIDSILVNKAPLENQHSYSGCGSSCTVYEGQQCGQKMLVVALSQLFAPDTTAAPDLPPKRRQVREQLQLQGSSTLMEQTIQCPICLGVMKDPVNASDQYAYCRACIQTHFNTQKAQGRTVVSPSTLKPMPDTVLTDSNHLRGSVSHWEMVRQQELKLVQARVAQQLKQQQLAWTRADPLQEFKAAEHLGLAHAAQAGSADAVHTLQQVLMRLNDAKLLAGSNSASTSSSSQQVLPLLAPIHCMCSDPPLLVMPKPQGGTLEQWIAATAASLSVDKVGGKDFTLAWVQQVSWPVGLQLLSDVAAALCALHQQQPAVVLGSVHAAAVHLPQPLPDASSAQQQQLGVPGGARASQLSLVALLSQLAPLSSCHPFLAAPETLLASGPASPAADVYGFGVLMFQLATGWLPQQYTAGTDEQIAAVMWCRDMMAQAGSTSPLAAAQALAKLPADSGSVPPLPTGEWTPYGRHLPSVAALQQLPPGYVTLMEQCLQRVAPARPCVHELSARLADMMAAGQGRAAPAGPSVMIEAMRAVEKRRAAGVVHAPTPLVVPRGYEPSQVSPTRC